MREKEYYILKIKELLEKTSVQDIKAIYGFILELERSKTDEH